MKTAKELLNEHPELTLIIIDSMLERAREKIVLALSDPLSIAAESEYATEELLLEALDHPNCGVRFAAATNKRATEKVLYAALGDREVVVRDATDRELTRRKNHV